MNGKPKKKEEVELRWNEIKRAVTAEVNYKMQCLRERELNEKLDAAWTMYKNSLAEDLVLKAEALELSA